jgi:hypothetical protein
MDLTQRRVPMLAAGDFARTPADLGPWMKALLRALDPAHSPVAG